jgi:hypothetical protein
MGGPIINIVIGNIVGVATGNLTLVCSGPALPHPRRRHHRLRHLPALATPAW